MRTTRTQSRKARLAAALVAITFVMVPSAEGHAVHFDHAPHGHVECRVEQHAHHDKEAE